MIFIGPCPIEHYLIREESYLEKGSLGVFKVFIIASSTPTQITLQLTPIFNVRDRCDLFTV